jgi:hypothetical protein
MLKVSMQSVIILSAKSLYAFHYFKGLYAQCHYAKNLYAE